MRDAEFVESVSKTANIVSVYAEMFHLTFALLELVRFSCNSNCVAPNQLLLEKEKATIEFSFA